MNTSPAILRHAQARLVQSWFAGLFVYAGYCYLHNVVLGQRVDGAGAMVSALAEWAIWLALAPAITVVVFRLGESGGQPPRLFLMAVSRCLPFVLPALVVRGGFDWLSGNADLLHLLYYHLPSYLGALVFTVAVSIWFWWNGIVAVRVSEGRRPANPRLRVMTSRGSHVLCAEEIDTLTAGGNYVDVVTGNGTRYLMRATMKELEAELAGSALVRTHRSHFANVGRAVRLEHRRSGNHVLVLAGGPRVPVSKAYRDTVRAAMRRFRAADTHGSAAVERTDTIASR